MEKAEIVIVGGQILALAVLVLLLGNYAGVGLGISTPHDGTVYWGSPQGGVTITKGAMNVEKSNASSISLYFSLAPSTTISSIRADRACVDQAANNTGETLTYTRISISFDAQRNQNYISFGPTEQPAGIGCLYTVIITDNLGQAVTWTGSVKVTG